MTDTCKLCGGKPVTYQWRYFEGEKKGLTVEMCKHEYAQRLSQGEPLALVLGQHIPDTLVTRKR